MSKPKIQFGDIVKDRITGLTGVVIGITTYLYNCDRASVQPRVKPGTDADKIPDTFDVDTYQLEVTDEPRIEFEQAMFEEVCSVSLGDLVEDKLTGAEGIVLGIIRWIHNGPTLIVQPEKLSKDDTIQKTIVFHHKRAKVLKPQKMKVEAEVPVVSGKKESGGPMDKVERSIG